MQNDINKISYKYHLPKDMERLHWFLLHWFLHFTASEKNIPQLPQVPLLPFYGSKANVGSYEYILTKGIEK